MGHPPKGILSLHNLTGDAGINVKQSKQKSEGQRCPPGYQGLADGSEKKTKQQRKLAVGTVFKLSYETMDARLGKTIQRDENTILSMLIRDTLCSIMFQLITDITVLPNAHYSC